MARKPKTNRPEEPTTVPIPDLANREAVVTQPGSSYIAGDTAYAFWQTDRGLPQSIDDAERQFGLDIYERMLAEPMLAGIERGLKVLVLSDGFHVEAAADVPPRVGTTPEQIADYERATETKRYIETVLDRLKRRDRDITETLWNLMDAARLGHKLAEATYDLIEDGPYKGMVGLRSLRCKPRQNYSFVVDEFNGLRGVSAKVPGGSMLVWVGLIGDASKQPNTIAPEKILVFRLDDVDGDPRGRSWFRGCYDPWYRKQTTKPEEIKTIVQFGGGSIDCMLAEQKTVPVDDPDSDGKTSLMERTRRTFQGARNGGVRIHPFGTIVQVNRPNGDALNAFGTVYDRHDREMVTAFLITARAVLEAKHGSKADGGDAQDVLDELKKYCQRRLCEAIRAQLFYRLVSASYGEAWADAYTPKPVMAMARQADFASNAPGAASLLTAGGLTGPEWDQVKAEKLGIEPVEGELVGAAQPDPNQPVDVQIPGAATGGKAGEKPAGFRGFDRAVPQRHPHRHRFSRGNDRRPR